MGKIDGNIKLVSDSNEIYSASRYLDLKEWFTYNCILEPTNEFNLISAGQEYKWKFEIFNNSPFQMEYEKLTFEFTSNNTFNEKNTFVFNNIKLLPNQSMILDSNSIFKMKKYTKW